MNGGGDMGTSSLEVGRALLGEPAFATMVINLVIGLMALLLRLFGGPLFRRRALRAAEIQSFPSSSPSPAQPTPGMIPLAMVAAEPSGPVSHEPPASPPPLQRLKMQAGGDALPVAAPPRWLGACAGFHLVNAVIFALILLPSFVARRADQSAMLDAMSVDPLSLLLVVCILVSMSALLLANLTERLTVPAAASRRPPLLPTVIMIGVVEGIFFALDRADIGYLIAEGVWLISCIIMTARLLRLSPRTELSSAGRSVTLATGIGFFARALLTLLGMLQVASALLPAGNVFTFASLGGVIGDTIALSPLLKAICTAWTGIGLLLMAGAWRQNEV